MQNNRRSRHTQTHTHKNTYTYAHAHYHRHQETIVPTLLSDSMSYLAPPVFLFPAAILQQHFSSISIKGKLWQTHTQTHTLLKSSFLGLRSADATIYLFPGHVDPEPDGSRCFMTTEEEEGAALFLFLFLTSVLGLQDPLQVPEGS